MIPRACWMCRRCPAERGLALCGMCRSSLLMEAEGGA